MKSKLWKQRKKNLKCMQHCAKMRIIRKDATEIECTSGECSIQESFLTQKAPPHERWDLFMLKIKWVNDPRRVVNGIWLILEDFTGVGVWHAFPPETCLPFWIF